MLRITLTVDLGRGSQEEDWCLQISRVLCQDQPRCPRSLRISDSCSTLDPQQRPWQEEVLDLVDTIPMSTQQPNDIPGYQYERRSVHQPTFNTAPLCFNAFWSRDWRWLASGTIHNMSRFSRFKDVCLLKQSQTACDIL